MPSILVDIKSDENAIINALCLIEELTIPSAEELNTSDTEVLVWYTKSTYSYFNISFFEYVINMSILYETVAT